MRILLVTNSYSTIKNPTRNIITKNLFLSLKQKFQKTYLLYNQYYRFFKSEKKELFYINSVIKSLFLLFSLLPYALYRAKNYDIIYVQRPIFPGLLMLPAKWLYQKKIVCYVHGSVNTFIKSRGFFYKLASFTLKSSDLVFTNSLYMKQRLITEFGVHSKVISPGYNSDVFNYQQSQKKVDLLFAGDAIHLKGIDVLLDTIKKYRDFYEENHVTVKIHCEGSQKPRYIKFVKESGLSDVISFGERLKEKELASVFRASKIVVMPSRTEALGLTGIEAIACGAFLIASNTGGIKEYVIPGVNGFLFEKENSSELHECIQKALNFYPFFISGQPLHAKSIESYRMEKAIEITTDEFKRLLSKKC